MSVEADNYKVLVANGYAVEDHLASGKGLQLYSPKHLYIGKFNSHEELALWVRENITK
ncbi:hypothetical protein [Oceanobacillus sp. FSL H7-0719]|uniref:hypothetical protein n=1 Tax=Oceanobacillus sp. FSL H7-0719 TaxID=2954507 RepID=UPI003246FFFE